MMVSSPRLRSLPSMLSRSCIGAAFSRNARQRNWPRETLASAQRGLLFGGQLVELGAAFLRGGGLELAASGIDVAAPRGAHRGRDAGLEHDLREAPDPLRAR